MVAASVELILENVRCFRGRHEIPIRPLTLLVGENSSGKTTLLAMLDAASDQDTFPAALRLDRPPYELGVFDNVVTQMEGAPTRIASLRVGRRHGDTELVATFASRDGAPVLSELQGRSLQGEFDVQFEPAGTMSGNITFIPEGLHEIAAGEPFEFPIHPNRLSLGHAIGGSFVSRRPDRHGWFPYFSELVWNILADPPSARSLGPVRARPQRTYDRISNLFEPEGDHVPSLLRTVLTSRPGKDRDALVAALNAYGGESGLFDELTVRRLGDQPSDPFQLRVTTGGVDVNLADVGYGVSQSLPIIVESVLIAPERWILVQQPEVHLHPRAQAALGSFFASLVASNAKRFVVETHSDYLVDRVRQEVARGKIASDDVLILFFDRRGAQTKVHPIHLDAQGNVLDAPPFYRRFFLEEELALLTRAST